MRIKVGNKTRLRLGKRASLEISIQAIVIVVLAMTLLGLGLGFVRNLFGETEELALGITDQVQEQILDDLRRGDKPLSFPSSEVKLEKGSSKNLAIGVKNTGESTLDFTVELRMLDSSGTPIAVTDPRFDNFGSFLLNSGQQSLSANEANVYPVRFTAKTQENTEIFEVRVMDTSTTPASVYASKTFFITVI